MRLQRFVTSLLWMIAGLITMTLPADAQPERDVDAKDNVPHVASWSPDGRYIAVSTFDHIGSGAYTNVNVRVFSVDTLNERIFFHYDETQLIHDLAWSPSGDKLYFSDLIYNHIYLHDVESGEQIGILTLRPYEGDTNNIESISVSPDGNLLAAASYYGWEIFDLNTQQSVLWMPVDSPMRWIGWHPDGSQFATTHGDTTLRFWSAQDYTEIRRLVTPSNEGIATWRRQRPPNPVRAAWSPDGSLLAVGDDEGVVRIWRSDDLSLVSVFYIQQSTIYELSWNPLDPQLLAVRTPAAIEIWNHTTGQMQSSYSASVGAWSPDGTRLFYADHEAGSSGESFEIVTPPDIVIPPTPSPDSAQITTQSAAAGFDGSESQ